MYIHTYVPNETEKEGFAKSLGTFLAKLTIFLFLFASFCFRPCPGR